MKTLNYLFLILLFSSYAYATHITLKSDFNIKESGNNLIFELKTKNQGDEPAFSIQFKLTIAEHERVSKTITKIDVNQEINNLFELNKTFKLPGSYPVILKTFYQDANSYRFSSLLVTFYNFQTPNISDIVIKGESVEIPSNSKNEVNFIIKNNSKEKQELDLKLYTPDEIQTKDDEKRIKFDSNDEKSVSFILKNFSGLEGSSYAVFLVAQYDKNNNHYAYSFPLNIKISKPQSAFSIPSWITIAVILMLTIIFIAVQFKKS